MLETELRRRCLLLRLALISLVLIAHGATCTHDFINFDDPLTLSKNPRMKPPSVDNALYYWSHRGLELYIPCTYTVWSMTAALSGGYRGSEYVLQPWGFHLVNLCCHLISVLAAFELLRLLLIAPEAAAIGSAIFAVHPLQVESVAWATSLKDVLSGAAALLAVWQYLRAIRPVPLTVRDGESAPVHRSRIVLATLAFAVATLAKPAAIVALPVAAILDRFIFKTKWQTLLMRLSPWILIALPVALVAQHVQPAVQVKGNPVLLRPLVALDALTFYLVKLVYPLSLCPDYGRTPQAVIEQGSIALSWIAPSLIGWIAWASRRTHPLLITAAAVALVSLLPTLGFIPFLYQRHSTVADRYVYLSMLGPAIMVGAFAHRYRVLRVPALTLIALLAVLSIRQETFWANSATLFGHAIAVSPSAPLNHLNYGAALAENKRFAEAAAQFHRALQLDPTDVQTRQNLDRLERLMAGS